MEFHLQWSQFCSPLLASEVVFVKMPSRHQKRRAKRREESLQNRDGQRVIVDSPAFGTMLIRNESGRLLETVIEVVVGELHKCPIFNEIGYVITITGQHLPVFADIMTIKLKIKKIEKTSKEKHFITRKLVGYRQRWCKKEGNEVLGKEK